MILLYAIFILWLSILYDLTVRHILMCNGGRKRKKEEHSQEYSDDGVKACALVSRPTHVKCTINDTLLFPIIDEGPCVIEIV